jgi:hypothetical protein
LARPLLQAALRYARQGIPVFPVWWPVDVGVCACPLRDRCQRPAKHPLGDLAPRGLHDATTDLTQVRRWWTDRPYANIGMPTGHVSGRVVVDIDKPEAKEELRPIPVTRGVHTGRGGLQLHYAAPSVEVRNDQAGPDQPTKLAPVTGGVDFRGDGGYVLLPPSMHASGQEYKTGKRKVKRLAPLPGEWLARLQSPNGRVERIAVKPGEKVDPGQRHRFLFTRGCAMRYRWFDYEDILPYMLGLNEAYCDPPKDRREVERLARDICQRYEAGEQPESDADEFEVVDADITRARRFQFLWENRVLVGYFNMMVGNEGIGKGNVAAWVAARLTRGQLSGDMFGRARGVLVVGDEDSWDDVWVPRLHAAGADLALCKYLKYQVDVTKDVPRLAKTIRKHGTALLYFDQLLDNLGITDSWKDKEVRDALAPLRRLARDEDIAVLASMHPNKRQGSFRDRVSGTPAFNALSRSSLYLAEHPHEDNRFCLVRPKGNYSVDPGTWEYDFEGFEFDNGKEIIATSRICNEGQSMLEKWAVLEGRTKAGEGTNAREVEEELLARVPAGQWVAAKTVLHQLVDGEGYAKTTITRARRKLGIATEERKDGWYWTR